MEQNNVIPSIGLGTSGLKNPGDDSSILSAIELGYRHIDTASLYGSEENIGKAIKEAEKKGVKREELFICTKIWDDQKGDVEKALRGSLKALQLDYVDLYIIHWPVCLKTEDGKYAVDRIPMHKIWAEMERMVEIGLAKHIGLSNFNFQLTNDLLSYCKIKPLCNQIELNPHYPQLGYVKWLLKEGIVPVAYSPIGASHFTVPHGQPVLLDDIIINELAKKYNKSPAQICLNWCKQKGHVVIPKSKNPERLKQNLEAFDFDLSAEDVEKIDSIKTHNKVWANNVYTRHNIELPIFD